MGVREQESDQHRLGLQRQQGGGAERGEKQAEIAGEHRHQPTADGPAAVSVCRAEALRSATIGVTHDDDSN